MKTGFDFVSFFLPLWFGFTFQNFLSFSGVSFDWFHDYCLVFLIFIISFVGVFLLSIIAGNMNVKVFADLRLLEFLWTLLPAMIMIFIGIPSMSVLYSYDSSEDDLLTVKVTGHQWYWSYDYSDFSSVEFDSYMKSSDDLVYGEFRLLEVDNRVVLPWGSNVRCIVTSSDVIHSWAVPSVAVKIDGNPGWMNCLNLLFNVPGLYYGQCSEICGVNHSFMPICLEVTSPVIFKYWLFSFWYFGVFARLFSK